MSERPKHLDLDREKGLTVTWPDDTVSFYPIAHLRKFSPSAEMRVLREQIEQNPLTVLPQSMADHEGPVTALSAELVGNYAIRISFSDGHHTGIYSWSYLREIDPKRKGR
ncbi:DUF971 domain-containing protein [Planctomycetales bacterium ZRK34]|nr:DUF971 domain-containing protein [Planctomycetales bacterium ZRK34]